MSSIDNWADRVRLPYVGQALRALPPSTLVEREPTLSTYPLVEQTSTLTTDLPLLAIRLLSFIEENIIFSTDEKGNYIISIEKREWQPIFSKYCRTTPHYINIIAYRVLNSPNIFFQLQNFHDQNIDRREYDVANQTFLEKLNSEDINSFDSAELAPRFRHNLHIQTATLSPLDRFISESPSYKKHPVISYYKLHQNFDNRYIHKPDEGSITIYNFTDKKATIDFYNFLHIFNYKPNETPPENVAVLNVDLNYRQKKHPNHSFQSLYKPHYIIQIHKRGEIYETSVRLTNVFNTFFYYGKLANEWKVLSNEEANNEIATSFSTKKI